VTAEVPDRATVAVIGGGIVGSSMARHLARLGWRDIVLLDKGRFPKPGGSTGHASNFLFPVDHSKEMTRFTQESIRQYRDLGVFTECGGFEVARTNERLEELKRRMASALAWGEPAELVSPGRVKELIPYVNPDVLLGGFWCPGVGVVDSVRGAALMREEAETSGALEVVEGVEVTGFEVRSGRLASVHTGRGDISTEAAVICCGIWSPRVARMAGAAVPLTPAVHQMITVGPVPRFEKTREEIEYPILRDMDAGMYERQIGPDMHVGSYAHRPILVDPDDIPSLDDTASPTELPFTEEDFKQQMEDAREIIPDILEDERVGVRQAFNGLLSLTPDGSPLLGETPEVRGLWTAAAVWIKEAPGVAKTVAEWMTGEEPEIDAHGSDIARFYEHHRTRAHVRARAGEGFNKTYGIVHPAEQWASNRDVRVSPFFHREGELRAEFIETAGWERPHWYESNRYLLNEYGDRVMPRPAEWDARWWSPIINAEHLAMRDRVGLVDLTAFAIFDVDGPGALDYLQRMAANQMDVAVGRVVYTPLLTEHAGIRADLTIMRLGEEAFRVVTGGATGRADRKWFAHHMPEDGSVRFHDQTSGWATLGVWGSRARTLMQAVTEEDLSNDGFPFATCRWITAGTLRVLASRISYVGELGWELYVPMEQGERLWDEVWEAGRELGAIPVGLGVYLTTGRLEKCYRSYGDELDTEFDPIESGLARPRVKEQDFIGKQRYLELREEEPAAVLCTLTVDDHTSSAGQARYMLGNEPILTAEGAPLVDRKGRGSYVTSAGSGPSVGKHILMGYLPPDHARVGEGLAVEYFGDRYPVTVAVAGNAPLFDPDNARVRS
jgi:glycine cleavage system aminomethyltransferase T/glycine/D-amino acid oxidase-like deaminating enzyme